MKEIIIEFFSTVGQKIAMLVLVGTTALTTGTAVSKIVNHQPEPSKTQIPGIITNQNSDIGSGFLASDNSAPTVVTPTETSKTNLQPTITPKLVITPKASNVIPKATITTTPTPVQGQSVNPSNLCIVTISGKLYDVTRLRSSHSGGDIFKCGTDMTASYQGKHGTSLSRMAAYSYDPNAPAGTNVTAPNTLIDDGSDDREDESNEDRYVENHKEEDEETDD